MDDGDPVRQLQVAEMGSPLSFELLWVPAGAEGDS